MPYYYKMMGMGFKGETTAFSEVFMGIPRLEPYAPRGSVLINGGATYVENAGTLVTLNLNVQKQLLNGNGGAVGPAMFTTDGIEMIISNSPNFEKAVWMPFQPVVGKWNLIPDPLTTVARVYVKYRDAQGLESIVENDGIMVMPAGTLGGIVGVVLLQEAKVHNGTPILDPGSSTLQIAMTDVLGGFDFGDVLPGLYNLFISRDGYVPQTMKDVKVVAGQDTDIGKITLLKEAPPPTCTIDLELDYTGGMLTMDFKLFTLEPATWATYLFIPGTPPFQIWSVPVPVIASPFPIQIGPLGFPSLGNIAIITVLIPTEGAPCFAFAVVDTGKPLGASTVTIPQIQQAFEAVRPKN